MLPVILWSGALLAKNCQMEPPNATAMMPIETLQMIPANPGSFTGRRWIVWSAGRGEGQSVHLALCSRDGKCKWQDTRRDAYLPTIIYIKKSYTSKTKELLLTVNYGAEAQEAEAITIGVNGIPRVLDRRSASSLSLMPDGSRLELDQAPGSVPLRECLGWSAVSARLQNVRCQE